MWVIEGYVDPEVANGRELVAVFSKMHHATVDGVSGANLISHLCSIEPDAPPLALTEITPFGHEPSRSELLGRGVVTTFTRPLTIPKALSRRSRASRRPSAGPAPAPRWRHR